MKRPEVTGSDMRAPGLRLVASGSAPARRQGDRPRALAPEGGRGRWRSRRDLVADRVALGAVGVICPLSLRAQLADRWRLFVRAEFSSVTELALEYGVSPQAARNWWMGVGGPSGAALAQAALTRRAAFERYIGGVVA